ncbi:MAG: hypothetical protein WAL10_27110 [Acetobacteraceae bacterium]
MGCFCHSFPPAGLLASLNLSASVALPGADIPLSLSAWLNLRGLPALPWEPLPNWLGLPLPSLRLNLRAVATISALAQLRAQVLAQFGLDLLIPGQALMFVRIVATMNARLSALAHLNFNPLAWLRLAGLNAAIDQINLALRLGLLLPSPSLMLSLTLPGGIPMPQWAGFLALLRALLPMIAAAANLNVSLTETTQFSAALRILARLSLPGLVAPQLMASLTAALNAVASLQASLGVSPLQLGFLAIQLRVSLKLSALLATLSARFGLNLSGGGGSLLAALLALLPNLPFVPTSFATSASVQAALQMSAFASLNWQVPLSLPVIGIGLPTCAFAASLSATLGLQAVLSAPCVLGCDAGQVMRSLATATAAA